jgi:DNA polymerase
VKTLLEVYKEINECEKCNLYKNRLTEYHWRGDPNSKIVLIGEALGAKEQELGYPFVGRSGRLLDKLIKQSGYNPQSDVYITNLVKCRPPENRNPFWDETKCCMSFLLQELRIINPKLIITLGRVPGDWYANGRKWGWNIYYRDRRWYPMYHPSYLLRNEQERTLFPMHFKNIMELV